jgi:NIMA (never in mitosis gene a)-related kinase
MEFSSSFVDDGVMHILMEYAPGGTLYRRVVDQEGALFEEGQIWEWFVQILLALKYVHSRNVLHRDLKTQNIMLGGPNCSVIKLGDFGIAKVIGAHDMAATVVGTPQYLSPELCQVCEPALLACARARAGVVLASSCMYARACVCVCLDLYFCE